MLTVLAPQLNGGSHLSPQESVMNGPTLSAAEQQAILMQQVKSNANVRKQSVKQAIAEKYIDALKARVDYQVTDEQQLELVRQHFQRLPTRYALDVNLNSLDIILHMRLLQESRRDQGAVFFQVRLVKVKPSSSGEDDETDETMDNTEERDNVRGIPIPRQEGRSRPRPYVQMPRPAFGSSPNLQALAVEANGQPHGEDEPSNIQDNSVNFYEITIAAKDQPKLLSFYTNALGNANLSIREAHAFNTSDGFTLDVFVCDGWDPEQQEGLEMLLSEQLTQIPQHQASTQPNSASPRGLSEKSKQPFDFLARVPQKPPALCLATYSHAPTYLLDQSARASSPNIDDWEINIQNLDIESKIAAGSFGTLYKGKYCGQEVAVKIINNVNDDTQQYQEFLQEINIMRKVRHRNVVQFIGACTRRPNLCILFEFMSGGSVYDFLKTSGPIGIPSLLKISLEVAKGMNYLHQCHIIHRDLKAANLLLDEHGTVKIADFGVARIMTTGGVMTAETGTYRWMAPEVIEHKPYDTKADVFSFGVVMWELLVAKVPYQELTPLQAAVGVVQKNLRPVIPPTCPPDVAEVLVACWQQSPAARPTFDQLVPRLEQLMAKYTDQEDKQRRQGSGLFQRLRGSIKER